MTRDERNVVEPSFNFYLEDMSKYVFEGGPKLVYFDATLHLAEKSGLYRFELENFLARFKCFLSAKHRVFDTLFLDGSGFYRRDCFTPVRPLKIVDYPDIHLTADLSNINRASLVRSLEIQDCSVSMEWLHSLLKTFKNIAYINMNDCHFHDVELPKKISGVKPDRTLKRLILAARPEAHTYDRLILYLKIVFPLVEDIFIDGLRIEFIESVINRFYPSSSASNNPSSTDRRYDSDSVLTFPAILSYMIASGTAIKKITFRSTRIDERSLMSLLEIDSLKHLKIELINNQEILGYDNFDISPENRARISFRPFL